MDGVIRVAALDIVFDDVFDYSFIELVVVRELVSIIYDMFSWLGDGEGIRGWGGRWASIGLGVGYETVIKE